MKNHSNDHIKGQYQDPKNLTARINLHQRFSTNPYGWMRWVFDQQTVSPQGRVLELGCGTGELWRVNAKRISHDAALVLTDASANMVRAARGSLRQVSATARFSVGDASSIPYADESFDAVIANHMLYHVDALADAISEIRRVLKPDGIFYATANGIDHLKEIPELLHEFDAGIDCPLSESAHRFGLENGTGQLRECFADVTIRRYQDSLRITEAEPLVDYILSLPGTGNVSGKLSKGRKRDLMNFVAGKIARQGPIIVTKDPGMLVAR